MNVLNLSLGGLSYTPASEDAEAKALTNAIAAGVVVVVSAGNSGPGTYTLNNPGNTPDAITVGATSNARAFLSQLRPTGPGSVPANLLNIAYVPGSGIKIPARIPATLTVDVTVLDGNGLACSAFSADSLRGKIAFVARGSCTFAAKVASARKAGAVAAIVYNDRGGEDAIEMVGLDASIIPAVMLSNLDGLALKSYLLANPSATVEIDDDKTLVRKPRRPRILSNSSARGPSPEFGLKPDLVAVGENIYSAAQKNDSKGSLYSDTGFVTGQGTSFSAPMVAGAAAVLKQLFPGFTPQDIKSALVTTANRTVTLEGSRSALVMEAGGGFLDMSGATAVGATFSPSSLSFGVSPYYANLSLCRSILIKNVSPTSDQFTLAVEPLVSGPTISLSRSSTGTLDPGGTSTVDVAIQSSSPLTGAFQGYVTIQSVKTSQIYRIPYWSGIYAPDTSRILTVVQSSATTGTAYTSLADALAKARPGNIIEIADSGSYPAGMTITTNEEGLPLHGITIRAAAGKTPTISGAGTGAPANITIIGLRHVLLQGITISGGEVGVEVTQTSTSFPASVTIDHCTITNISDTKLGVGVEAGGGTVFITASTISKCSLEGILASGGAQLMVNRSTLDSNGQFGIEAYRSNVEILNSTLTNHTGPGAYLEACTGTIDGSRLTKNLGKYGDGVEIVGGRFRIANNTIDANERHGLGLFVATSGGPGPAGFLINNTIMSNAWNGVLVNTGQNLFLDGNLIKDNGCGIEMTGTAVVLLTNNIVTRSKGFAYPDPVWYWPGRVSWRDATGILIQGASTARIVNNTLANNRAGCCLPKEVSAASESTVTIANSIIEGGYPPGSMYKDHIKGLQPKDIQFSLVSDPTFATGTNIFGNPKFIAPESDDFGLLPDSPAIDAGASTVDNLPFLDYTRRLRVTSLQSRAGEGKVDMGAIEANSSYPLVFPLMANAKQALPGEDFTTGFALHAPIGGLVDITAYNPEGALLAGASNPASRLLVSGTQVPILGSQLFGLDAAIPQLGAVLAGSLQKLVGFFLLFDKDFQRFADGVDVTDRTSTDLVFMRHQDDAAGRTAYCLFNPGTNPANVSASLYTTAGSAVGTPKTGLIPPKGQFVFSFDGITLSSGHVRVRSDRPLSGVEIFGNRTELSALKAMESGTDGRLYFPHFAVNQGFSTLIGLLNTTTDWVANITLMAYGSDGSLLGAPVRRQLPLNGQLLEPVKSLFGLGEGLLLTGYIVVHSDKGGLAGFTGFRYDDGLVQSAAAVPATSIPRPQLLFSHIAHQVSAGSGGTYQTGIALLNPFGVSVPYTLRVYDGAGAKVAEMTGRIAGGEKIARILSHPVAGAGFFTQPLSLGSGHVEVISDLGLIGFELFFTEDFSQLASVPAQVGK